jgi:hypothetical protein
MHKPQASTEVGGFFAVGITAGKMPHDTTPDLVIQLGLHVVLPA